MWQKLLSNFLMALLTRAFYALKDWIVKKYREYLRKKDHKKRTVENAKKAKDHEDSNIDDSDDTFRKLP